jgi:hypothetical protein
MACGAAEVGAQKGVDEFQSRASRIPKSQWLIRDAAPMRIPVYLPGILRSGPFDLRLVSPIAGSAIMLVETHFVVSSQRR